jgi:predicted metal-dependent hydrolase
MEIKIHKLIRTKRKTLVLEISHDGNLIVRAPEKASTDAINRFIHRKRFWIHSKQELVRQRYQSALPKKFIDGEEFLYLGNTYRLKIINNGDIPFALEDEFLLSHNHLDNASEIIQNWYKKQAQLKILERVCKFSVDFGFVYSKINVTNAKTRWGSCSAKGNLNFSWRLIMAPLRVIDYVVVHELVHLEVKNHSRDFWNRVKTVFPDYEQSRKWLKQNGYTLTF